MSVPVPWLRRGWRPACLVVAGGPLPDPGWLQGELALRGLRPLCVDGGLRHLALLGLSAGYWIGDGDSLGGPLPEGIPSELYPAAKDRTDLELGLEWVARERRVPVAVLGALGGRLDHTLANLHLAAAFRLRTGPIVLYGDRTRVRIVGPGAAEILLPEEGYERFSLIPLGGSAGGIRLVDARWELDGAALGWDEARGVSNYLAATRATVSIETGALALIESGGE